MAPKTAASTINLVFLLSHGIFISFSYPFF
jgi:hypothetical protein